MDSFMAAASDLDSILDQFEQNEDSTTVLQPDPVALSKPIMHPYGAPSSSQIMNGVSVYHTNQETPAYGSGDSRIQGSEHTTLQQAGNRPDELKSTGFLLDLSEADFAPAAPQTLSLHTLTSAPSIKPGQFQPVSVNNGVQDIVSGISSSSLDITDHGMLQNRTGYTVEPERSGLSTRTNVASDLPFSNAQPAGMKSPIAVTETLQPVPSEQHITGNFSHVNANASSSGFPKPAVNIGNTRSGNVTGVQPSLTSQPLHVGVGSQPSPTKMGQQSSPIPINSQSNSISQLPMEQGDTRKESDRSNTAGTLDNQQDMSQHKDVLDTKPLSKAMTPAPLRPELMHEYVKQGARPKIITNIKTPESPVKAVSETTTLTKPNTGISQPKPAVGFGSVASVKVTDADLEALEQEVGIMPAQEQSKQVAQPVSQPQLKQSHLNIDELNAPGERASPVSKLLNEHLSETSVSKGNELAGLDPFFSHSGGGSKQDNVVTTTKHNNLLESSPMPVSGRPHPSLSSTPLPTETQMQSGAKDNVLPNDVLSKNAKNLLRNNQSLPGRQPFGSRPTEDHSTQLNNVSNSHVQVPKVAIGRGEIPDASLTALQGISLATSATSGTQSPQPRQHSDVNSLDPIEKNNINKQRSLGFPGGFPSPPGTKNTMDQTQPLVGLPASPFMPADPPSYQDVRNAMSGEVDRRPDGLRQGLTLNFDQPGPRKVAQALPPSPIVEDIQGREEAFSVPDQNAAPENLHPNLIDMNQPTFHAQPQVPVHVQQPIADANTPLFVTAPNAVTQNNQFTDNDSMTPSNETDSEEGEFSRRVMDYSEGVMQLGAVAPVWVPDAEALNCMNCQQKFTFRKRRHHCRACGKVFCARCCSMRLKLKYMESKEARVCISCLNAILRAQALQRTQAENQPDPVPPPDQDNISTISNTSESLAAGTAGSRSSLRRPSNDGTRPREIRKVRFSDGVNPGVEQSIQDAVIAGEGTVPVPTGMEPSGIPASSVDGRQRGLGYVTESSLIPPSDEGLPPVIIATETKGEYNIQQYPVAEELIKDMKNTSALPVAFALNKNLLVKTKILDLNCCVNRTCWCFSTKGMATVGQDEIVIVLECLPDEKTIPKDIFHHLQSLYEEASRGITVSHMGHSIISQSFLGGREHGGFLYLRPSFQCLGKLLLPEPPYLFAVLLQKWETPWAKVFPLRLLLRLGAEFRYYPCPLMSVRFRKPVFGEIGHTIMNLLADFKNYQYKLPVIPGIVIHMQDRETLIQIPRNRYDEVMKVVNNSNEHVMAIAANFSAEADSHLVCIQNDEGTYHTQAISIQNKPRKVTGASFVVFNGALKTTSGLTAKSSIVEDGLMIQILPETMAALRQALREMLDLPIPCGSTQAEQPDETVTVTWVDDDKSVNLGVVSPIDRRSLEGVESIRILNGTDFRGRSHSLRWTEVFFLENNESPVDLSRLAEMLSTAFCVAMTGQLDELHEAGIIKLALRVTVDSDNVGYEAGSKGKLLPPVYMNELDNELIPVLHNAVSQHEGGPVIMELVFYIIE